MDVCFGLYVYTDDAMHLLILRPQLGKEFASLLI